MAGFAGGAVSAWFAVLIPEPILIAMMAAVLESMPLKGK
jgi:hypothetical protein